MGLRAAVVVASVGAGLAAPAPALALTAQFIDLGVMTPAAVNVHDEVAGVVDLHPGSGLAGGIRGRLWKDGRILATLGPFNLDPTIDLNDAQPYDISDDGDAVGQAGYWFGPGGFDGYDNAARWDDGHASPTALVTLPQNNNVLAHAFAISPNGQYVVGRRSVGSGSNAFAVGLALPASADSLYDVNDRGQMLGRTAAGAAVLWSSAGAATTLTGISLIAGADTPGYQQHALGEDGSVVGSAPAPPYGGVLRRPDGTIVKLGTLVNPAATQGGAVLGQVQVSQPGHFYHAALWKGGKVIDLDRYAPASWTLDRGIDLSTHGTIVGVGTRGTEARAWMIRFKVVLGGTVGDVAAPRSRAVAAVTGRSGVRVTVKSLADGKVLTDVTDARGRWSIPVDAGRYRVTFGAAGCIVRSGRCVKTVDVTAASADLKLDFHTDARTNQLAPTLPRGARLTVAHGAVALPLTCRLATAGCRGSAKLVRVRAGRRVTLASATVSVAAGRTAKARLALTAAGRAQPRPVGIALVIAVRVGRSTVTTTRPVTLA